MISKVYGTKHFSAGEATSSSESGDGSDATYVNIPTVQLSDVLIRTHLVMEISEVLEP